MDAAAGTDAMLSMAKLLEHRVPTSDHGPTAVPTSVSFVGTTSTSGTLIAWVCTSTSASTRFPL
eukprot:scaffold38244_cov30-Tisochrysis_lutea.AAC.6